MISGEAFTLQATIGSLVPSSSYGQLKFEVTNASGLEVTTVLTQTGSSGDTDLAASTLTTAQVVRSNEGPVTSGTPTLAVSTASTDSGTVSVNAWLDANGDNLITLGEFASGAQVITFVKAADVTWTTTLAQPFIGDTKLTATITSDKSINLDQFKSEVQIGFATLSGSTYTTVGSPTVVSGVGAFTVGETTTFVSATNSLKVEKTATAAASTTYVAQAIRNTGDTELGSESAKAVAAATILKLTTPSITAGDDLSQSTNVITARNGITSFTATSQAWSNSGATTKSAAGIAVKVTITEGSATGNTDAATFVAGGKTLKDTTSAADSIEFTVNTDATGLVSIPVTVSGTVAGTDSITILVAAQSATAVASTLTTTVNFANATVADGALVDANQIGSGAIYKKVAGSTTTLKFAAKDSFGKGLGSTYRVLLTESGSSPSVIKDAVFSNGIASFSVADSATVSEVYSAQLQSYSSSTLTWSNGSFSPAVSVTPVIGASEAVGSVATLAGTATTALALNLNDLKAVDTRSGGSAPTVTSGTVATLSGTVLDANSIPTYGEVTLSATGAMFETNGVFALGSITVQTNNSGAFGGVKIYSNTAGKNTVTATSNGKTKTLDLTFDSAGVATGSVYTLDAPLRVAPGATLTVTPIITDKYGNKVAQTANFTFAYSGPGLPINANATTTANTAFRVLLGAGDTGAATVTWTVDKNADADTTDTGEIVTATIVIGATPATVATANVAGSTKRFFVSVDGNTSAKNVVVKVAGKTFKTLKGSSAKKTYVVAAPKGSHKVTVYVGGKLVATKTISVK
jgi:hypothetical protein